MTKWLIPVIIAAIAGFGGIGYYFKDDILDKADPDHNRDIGNKYFGGKKTRHRRYKKGKNSRRK